MAYVRDIIAHKGSQVYTVRPDELVFDAVVRMEEHKVGALVVTGEGGRVCGMLTERDYLRKIAIKGRSSRQTPVADVMSSPVACAGLDDTVRDCMRLMTERRFRHLPVVGPDGALAGLISIGDCVKEVISEQKVEIRQLHAYIQGEYPG